MFLKKTMRALLVGAVTCASLTTGLALTEGTAAAATKTFPVKTALDGRTVKDPKVAVGEHRISDMYPTGSMVSIVCQEEGPSYGGSTVWDLTTDGYWVPDAYVKTGSDGYVMGKCSIPKSYKAKVDLNGRQKKGQDNNAPGAVVDKYKAGQSVKVKCQATAKGAIWDKTTDNLWVPDKYIKTGTDGFVQGLPRCDTGSGDTGGGSRVHGRNNGPAGSTAGTRQQKIERVINAAVSQTGKGYDYSWGAGGKGGPSYGIHHFPDGNPANGDDYNRYGYDCSGLTLYAFWKGAGVDIGSWTGAQYRSGTKIPVSQMRRGDMIFWGKGDDAGTTTHVAIYLGNNKLIEAAPPRDGKSVHVRSLYERSAWTKHVIRVI
ncbi:NlpC/P60 family protein [Nocardiopsis gilva]